MLLISVMMSLLVAMLVLQMVEVPVLVLMLVVGAVPVLWLAVRLAFSACARVPTGAPVCMRAHGYEFAQRHAASVCSAAR